MQPTAIITGAFGGIGRAISHRLVADGYLIAMFDVTGSDGTGVPEGALRLSVDVTQADAVRTATDRVVAELGRLDAVVNCAGTVHRDCFEETSVDAFMTDVRTNLLGTFLMCQSAVFPHMRSAGSGRLINIASISGKRGGVGPLHPCSGGGRSGAGYVSSKAGVINLTRWIAREVGRWGIRCNAIAPGVVAAPMNEGVEFDLDDLPAGRLGRPEEIADAVSWLARAATDYVHGAVIDVDGGLIRA